MTDRRVPVMATHVSSATMTSAGGRVEGGRPRAVSLTIHPRSTPRMATRGLRVPVISKGADPVVQHIGAQGHRNRFRFIFVLSTRPRVRPEASARRLIRQTADLRRRKRRFETFPNRPAFPGCPSRSCGQAGQLMGQADHPRVRRTSASCPGTAVWCQLAVRCPVSTRRAAQIPHPGFRVTQALSEWAGSRPGSFQNSNDRRNRP